MSSSLAVTNSTGVQSPAARNCRHRSSPSMSGRPMSSTIAAGRSCRIAASPSWPVPHRPHPETGRRPGSGASRRR